MENSKGGVRYPGWVLVAEIFGIILSLSGLYCGVSVVLMPEIVDFQSKIMPQMMEAVAKNMPDEKEKGNISKSQFNAEEFSLIFKPVSAGLTGERAGFKRWCYTSGGLLVLISGLYLFSSIMFFQLKKRSITWFIISLSAMCLYSGVNFVFLMFSGSIIGIGFAAGSIISFALNGVLLLVVCFSYKSGFEDNSDL
jgi:hypothetical protein